MTNSPDRAPRFIANGWFLLLWVAAASNSVAAPDDIPAETRHPISELVPTAKIHLAKTADWVAITDDAVWVGTTGPDGVAQIDPRTNSAVTAVALPGNPCAGLAVGFGGLWVPLCGKPNSLARVDLRTREVAMVPGVGPADREGGITVSRDGVWLVTNKRSTLAKIEPHSLQIVRQITAPNGSLNPLHAAGLLWLTRSTGAQVSIFDSDSGSLVGTISGGPGPRFLDAGDGSVWTLNQGDGSLTQIDIQSKRVVGTTQLHTPGRGGDIKVAGGIVWTTMAQVPLTATDARTGKVLCQWVGPGGDSLGVSHEAIWLTDYDTGDVYRYELKEVLRHCPAARQE